MTVRIENEQINVAIAVDVDKLMDRSIDAAAERIEERVTVPEDGYGRMKLEMKWLSAREREADCRSCKKEDEPSQGCLSHY
jgi:hypothetical protein